MAKPKFLAFVLALLCFSYFSLPAQAADDAPSQPYVVIVGIDQYKDQQILPRKHAEADARALYDLFVNKDYLGVDPSQVRLLLGTADEQRKSQPATRANILKALTWVVDKAGKDDLVIFAFIGQGAPLGERACYFAADSTFKNRAKDAVACGDIEDALDKLKSQRFCAFIDVNFLGFNAGKETAPDPHINKFYREFLGKDDDKGQSASRIVFLANPGLKPSLELDKHGVLTQVLLDGLGGKADRDGYEPDGLITVGELAAYVRKELPELARTHGKTDAEKVQQPRILEGQATDFVLDLNPAVTPVVKRRLDAFDKLARDNALAKALIDEGRDLLRRMPKLDAQQSLRKAYQKLADGQLAYAVFQKEREKILEGTRLTGAEANRYAEMVLRATEVVRQNYVEETRQGSLVESAIRGLYKRVDEKIPPPILQKLEGAKRMSKADLLKLLAEARTHLGKREDLTSGKDITLSLQPMLGKLDRHTDYSDPETVAKDRPRLEGNFSGIGVQIRKNNLKDKLEVVTPIMGSPAYQAKLYAGDIISTIIREVDNEGKPLPAPEVISTKGMSTEDAVGKILGKPGTKIKLLVEREGHDKPLEFNLIRGRVELETVLGHKRGKDDSWNYVIDPENKICYVRVTEFSRTTARDLGKIMKELTKNGGIKGFILDLRGNPGGLLPAAVGVADLFIDDGVIVTVKTRNADDPTKVDEQSWVGHSDGSYTHFPMVCLVNGYSASGSEIVAAALQDYGRAVIVGSRSYGKGTVQTILPFLPTGGALKLTTATFWRPSGRNLNKASTKGRPEDEWGVLPNKGFVLDLPTKELNDLFDFHRDQEIIHRPDRRNGDPSKAEFRDRQLDLALQYLRGQIRTAAQPGNGKKAG